MDTNQCSSPCSCCSNTNWPRSVKRKFEPDDEFCSYTGELVVSARVEVENEVAVLRELVSSQQQTIQELMEELEEERSASATATSEAMLMIQKLQREKADVQMDARNFKRFAEEQMVHDHEEIVALEEALASREEALQALLFQVEAYRCRLASIGVEADGDVCETVEEGNCEVEVDTDMDTPLVAKFDDVLGYEYPQLRCNVGVHIEKDEVVGGDESYPFEDSMGVKMEMMGEENEVLEKDVVEQISVESCEDGSELDKIEEFPNSVDRPLDEVIGGEELSDREYTVVAEHEVPVPSVSRRREERRQFSEFGEDEDGSVDIRRLNMRLQALEEDRESMRQAIMEMRREKAELMRLEEMAHQIQREATPERAVVKKKRSWIETFSFVALIKWVVSFVLWRRNNVSQSKYTFGMSKANVGLLLLLDKSPQISHWRCPARIQV